METNNNEIKVPNDLGTVTRSSALIKKMESSTGHDKTNVGNEEPCNDIGSLKQSFDFIAFFGNLLGWRYSYEWKTNPRHWFWITFLAYTWSQFLYTQFKHFMDGNYRGIFEVCAMYGAGISVALRVRCYLLFFKQVTALHNFTIKITRQAGRYAAKQLERQHLRNLKHYKFIALVTVSAIFLFVYTPMKSFIVNRELLSIMPLEITFVEQSNLSGYLVANVIMAVMGGYAIAVSLFMSLNFYAVIFNYSIQVDLIEYDVRELDSFWSGKETTSLSYRHMFLRNICQKCQDKDSYITEVKKIYDETIFFYFASTYFAQIVCLYEVEVENWMPGYGIAYGLCVEMLFHCFFGTRCTIVNERLCYILTQSEWYTYDLHSQKILLELLNSCMNSKELWIGPFAPLSVISGIQILKSIYSYYTVLAEVA